MNQIHCNKAVHLTATAEPIAVIDLNQPIAVETINAYGDYFEDLAGLLHLIQDKSGQHHHHPLTGPIYVNGVNPGDVLKVDIESIVPREMAQALSKTAGVDPLVGDPLFGDRSPIIGTLIQRRGKIESIHYQESMIFPCNPMIGIIGTAPRDGFIKTGHAAATGGNLDLPFVTQGVSVYLPVEVPGANLYLGDCHALQAYGELGGIAMECSAQIQIKVSKCSANQDWFETDPYLKEDEQRSIPPIIIVGKEPLTEKEGIAVVGVAPAIGNLDKAVVDAYRNSVRFLRQICPRASWGGARNLLTIIGHSLNGQASSRTAESTSMIFFKKDDLRQLYRSTSDVLYEIMETVYPLS